MSGARWCTALAGGVGALVLVSASAAALPGKVVGRGTASGQFAIVSAHASIRNPLAPYVRLVGRVENGTFIVGCNKGFSISANSYERNRSGLYRLPIRPGRAESCDVTGSIGGTGRIVVEIRAAR
jgi:hypothetical protein